MNTELNATLVASYSTDEERRYSEDRRSEVRCECKHSASCHYLGTGPCYAIGEGQKPCRCNRHVPAPDRREVAA